MADVIEVVHKITYDVDDRMLQNATRDISLQILELKRLTDALHSYERQLNSYKVTDTLKFNELSQRIEEVNRKVEVSAGRMKKMLEQIGDGLIRGLGSNGKIDTAISDFTAKVVEGFRKVDSFDFKSIGSLATSLLSFTNIAPLAISFLTDFAVKMLSADNAAAKADESYRKFLSTIKNNNKGALRSIDEQSNLVKQSTTEIFSKGANSLGAAQKLVDQYPGFFKSSTKELANAGNNPKAKAELDNLLKQIAYREKGLVQSKNAVEYQERLRDLQQQETKALGEKVLLEKQLQEVNKIINEAGKKDFKTGGEKYFNVQNTISNKLENTSKEYNRLTAEVKRTQNAINILNNNALVYANLSPDLSYPEYKEPVKDNSANYYRASSSTIYRSPRPKIQKSSALDTLRPTAVQPLTVNEVPPKVETASVDNALKEQQDKAKKAAEERKALIQDNVKAYQDLAAEAVKAINTIYDAQIKALDNEIEIRRKRVDEASKLAERGNTEALRIEQERLDAVLKRREEYARREQILNSALAVSNAILAVAQAASETGAGAIGVVPAVIAAIIAGYAAISASTKESTSQAFADGVVDYKGKGGPRDDANWVRISSGESVITADGTKRNRHLLEAINKGAELKMINPALAYTMPVFKSPQQGGNGYASQYDLKTVEGKLDSVVNAIEDNRLRQNIYFNEHGVGIMTERAIRKERKRWA